MRAALSLPYALFRSLPSAARALPLGLALGLTALAGTGCSDPVPPLPEGGWSVQFTSPGGSCTIAGHNVELGTVNGTMMSELIQDGDDADISCTVSGSSIEGSAFRGVSNLDIIVNGISSENTKDNPAPGVAAFSSANTAGELYVSPVDTPCNFWFEGEQFLQAGEAWVSFSCDVVENEGSNCRIGQGYAAFKNCE